MNANLTTSSHSYLPPNYWNCVPPPPGTDNSNQNALNNSFHSVGVLPTGTYVVPPPLSFNVPPPVILPPVNHAPSYECNSFNQIPGHGSKSQVFSHSANPVQPAPNNHLPKFDSYQPNVNACQNQSLVPALVSVDSRYKPGGETAVSNHYNNYSHTYGNAVKYGSSRNGLDYNVSIEQDSKNHYSNHESNQTSTSLNKELAYQEPLYDCSRYSKYPNSSVVPNSKYSSSAIAPNTKYPNSAVATNIEYPSSAMTPSNSYPKIKSIPNKSAGKHCSIQSYDSVYPKSSSYVNNSRDVRKDDGDYKNRGGTYSDPLRGSHVTNNKDSSYKPIRSRDRAYDRNDQMPSDKSKEIRSSKRDRGTRSPNRQFRSKSPRRRSRSRSPRSPARSDARYRNSRHSKPSRYEHTISRRLSSKELEPISKSYDYKPKERERGRDVSQPNGCKRSTSEREVILQKWRSDYCSTREEVSHKIEELSKVNLQDIINREKKIWIRTTPADLFYVRDEDNSKIIQGTDKLKNTCSRFYEELVLRAQKINSNKPKYEPPPRKNRARVCKHKTELCSSSEEDLTDEEDCTMEELQRKQKHPDRLHPEMWYNDPGEMNDGPLCRCSMKSRKSGIRHGIYPGEKHLPKCDPHTNNSNRLYHYRITISPPTNFLIKTPTIIQHDEHEFIFEGFSVFSHFPLEELPTCKVIRFNIKYDILYIEEKVPENFTVRELDLFSDYLFKEILELVDLDFKAAGDNDGCPQFHFMPRFVRELPDNGKEILSMNEVLQYLLRSSIPLISEDELEEMVNMTQYQWQAYADGIKGMVVTYPGKKPCSVRVDQLDRNIDLQKKGDYKFPEIVHFGIRPPQLSYAGNPDYQKAWRDYVKFRHLLANMSKPTYEDKRKLEAKENKLQEMRTQGKMKRDVTIAVSSEGFYRTGIMCDVIQHAMLVPVLVCHLRFHQSLNILEESVKYKFNHRNLLQLALTHPSYRENFGTNPDHARNSLTNCGIRQPEYGDRRIHYMNTRKRGINTLINIMSRFGKQEETESNITHNERLEFLGDAVVEFLSSIHLFYSFPDLEEGGLATYRAAIVQNQHLAVLARILNLDQYMLYAHGSDLCHDLELRHAMANCFEALMGALFLDGGIDVADRVFCETLFKDSANILEVWTQLPPHPLQEQEPTGDREWIPKFDLLVKLTEFEKSIGVEFNHIRLLARAFTDRSVGYTNLTLGSNQRLEFLGDTVLQLIASEYLYKFFPEHHEGHLSLLRSSLVNNRTQAVVCDDLGMANYAVYNNPKAELKTKDRADLLEAFIGALYVDKGLEFCEVFCQVTLFPRLQDFIMNQDWNDPKSKLQQCCLTLRTMDGGEPDIPVYKVIECKGPTNTRVYTVAVYFRGTRLASAMGHSIQQAEMNAAKNALEISQHLFPQLDHQKRVIAKSMKKQRNKRNRSKSLSRTPFGPAKSPERYSRSRFKEARSRSKSSERLSSQKNRKPSRNRHSSRGEVAGSRSKKKGRWSEKSEQKNDKPVNLSAAVKQIVKVGTSNDIYLPPPDDNRNPKNASSSCTAKCVDKSSVSESVNCGKQLDTGANTVNLFKPGRNVRSSRNPTSPQATTTESEASSRNLCCCCQNAPRTKCHKVTCDLEVLRKHTGSDTVLKNHLCPRKQQLGRAAKVKQLDM